MTADSYGPKNQPRFDATKPPDLGVDETLVSEYAATVGNQMVGTKAEMDALPQGWMWQGLMFFASDRQTTYLRDGGAWVVAGNPGLRSRADYQFRTTEAVGGRTLHEYVVPRRRHPQRVIIDVLGTVGASDAGYATVFFTASAGTFRTNADLGANNGAAFPAGQFVSLSRRVILDVPTDTACTVQAKTDQNRPNTQYAVLVSYNHFGEGTYA